MKPPAPTETAATAETAAQGVTERVARQIADRALGAADEVVGRLADVADGERVSDAAATEGQTT